MICFVDWYTLEFHCPMDQSGPAYDHIIIVRAFWGKYKSETRYLRVADFPMFANHVNPADILKIGFGEKTLLRVPAHLWEQLPTGLDELYTDLDK